MTSRSFRILAILLPGLLASAPAQAQSDTSKSDQATDKEIIVEAPEVESNNVWRQSREITRQTAIRDNPLERFQRPICPAVTGMPAKLAIRLIGRMLYNAERVGAPLAEEGDCEVNILVAFVRDGEGEVEGLRKSGYFRNSGMDYYDIKELRAETGAARAWNNVAMRSRYGENASGGSGGGPPTIRSERSTRLSLNVRGDIDSSTVVIDVFAIDGMSVDQIADYATMRAFARTKEPDPGTTYETILSLFDGGTPPDELTSFDVAYLKSLYTGQANLAASTKLSRVTRAMAEEEAARIAALRGSGEAQR